MEAVSLYRGSSRLSRWPAAVAGDDGFGAGGFGDVPPDAYDDEF